MAIKLRDYQEAGLDALRHEFGPGRKKRVVLYSPTGSGKTEMGMDMIRGATAKSRRVMFVCHRLELIGQASRRFYAAGIRHGIIQGENTIRTYEYVLICSIQTLASRGYPEDVGLIVIDEAHAVAGSEEYRKLIMSMKGVPVIGLTATPFSKGLGKHYDELGGPLFESIAKSVTIKDLIRLGWLVDVDIYAPSEPDLSAVKIVAGDYHQKQLGDAVDKSQLIGDIVTHWLKLADNKRTVCFATNIAHSQHIVTQFKAAGVAAEHIDCYTPDDERREILNRLATGSTRVVSNVSVLAEGWDCPNVEVMILARPTRSLIRYIQMAGRVLRPAEGKSKALILDHSGSCKLLGFPTDDLPLELDDGKPKQSKAHERKEPLPKECPSCHYLKQPKVHTCPRCGFAPQKRSDVTTGDGELVQVKGSREQMPTAEKVRLYAELLGHAQKKGWKPGWAYHALKDLVGTYPHRRDVEPQNPSRATMQLITHLNIRRAKARANQEARHAA